MKRLIATALVPLAAMAALPGSASAYDPDTAVVFERSLLESATGQKEVYSLFQKAARQECRDAASTPRSLSYMAHCSAALLDDFVADLGDENVAQLHKGVR